MNEAWFLSEFNVSDKCDINNPSFYIRFTYKYKFKAD